MLSIIHEIFSSVKTTNANIVNEQNIQQMLKKSDITVWVGLDRSMRRFIDDLRCVSARTVHHRDRLSLRVRATGLLAIHTRHVGEILAQLGS